MLYRYVVLCQVHIVPYHLQSRVSQYLLKRKYIATVNQKSGSKRMPAEMSMKPSGKKPRRSASRPGACAPI